MNLVKQESACTKIRFFSSQSVCLVMLTWEMSALTRYNLRTTYEFHACRCEMPSYLCVAPARGWCPHTVLCQRDFALILVVFRSLREVFGRKCMVALFAQKHGEAGQGARHHFPTPNPCRSCRGASPRAAGRTCGSLALGWDALQPVWFSQDLSFQWSIICQRWVSLGLCKEHPPWLSWALQ